METIKFYLHAKYVTVYKNGYKNNLAKTSKVNVFLPPHRCAADNKLSQWYNMLWLK